MIILAFLILILVIFYQKRVIKYYAREIEWYEKKYVELQFDKVKLRKQLEDGDRNK